MFNHYSNLGYNNPYYILKGNKFQVFKSFPDTIQSFHSNKSIDSVAVIELLNKGFIFADRTLIQGMYKTPWQAKPNKNLDNWHYADVPKHDNRLIHEEEIAETLFHKICNEIEAVIGDKTKIGVLLSGGMDSRMVAGALDYLIKIKRLTNMQITGLTWGNDNTRDVVYAKEIASRLGWEWKHYKVTTEDLINNISETATYGCEYSPVHLHAIPQIRDDNQHLELILAGSYGDSVGRAEYSGKNVRYLKPIDSNITNFSFFFKKDVYKKSLKGIQQDILQYHKIFPQEKPYMQYELDYQLHYMRRMLNTCMQLFTEKMEFYQVFTHPDVFGYMWSISPEKRNDSVYENMLKLFKTKLDDIPWARTGMGFGQKNGVPDKYLKEHHNYSQQIYQILFEHTAFKKVTQQLKTLGIFNIDAIETIYKILKKNKNSNLYFLDKMLWLISLSEMIEKYNVQGEKAKEQKSNLFNPALVYYYYYKVSTMQKSKKVIKKILKR